MQKLRLSMHGHTVAYVHEGSGPVLLLIHGMAGSANTWEAAIPLLAKRFTVIAPDLPGHGDSEKFRTDYTLGAYATTLRDLLLRLNVDHATIIGQSYGGGVAMQFAHQFPDQCERLVLVGAGGLGQEVNGILRTLAVPGAGWLLVAGCTKALDRAAHAVGRLLQRLGLRTGPTMTEIARSYTSLTDPSMRESFLQTLRSVIDVHGQRVSASDYMYLGAELPTLIIWGDADPIIPVKHAYWAHERLPNSRLEIFPGAGHFPHCEDPERFATVVTDFIAHSAHPAMTMRRRQQLLLAAG